MRHPLLLLIVCLTAALAGTTLAAVEGPHGAEWGPSVSEAVINTGFAEGCPIETADGLSLLIASNREEPGGNDIWVADRASIQSPWSPPRKLNAANSSAADFCPSPVHRYLFFVSTRPGAGTCGAGDMYVIRQSPFGDWTAPAHLACAPNGPNTSGPEFSPSLVETADGTYLFYSSNGGAGDQDIYMSTLGENGFGPGVVVNRLSSPWDDFMPNVRALDGGGFEVVFNSNRPGWGPANQFAPFGGQDVYHAWIESPLRTGNWSSPRNLGENVNTAGNETRATLSADGQRLHFGRDGDIYVSQRQ